MPKHRVILDSQVLTTFQICEEMMNLRFNLNLVPISGTGAPIEKGALMHEILRTYYLGKREHKSNGDCIQNAIVTAQEFITGCPVCILKQPCDKHKEHAYLGLTSITPEEAHYVQDTFLQYTERWKNDSWTTLEVEHVKGDVIYEDDDISVLWKAKIDWLVDNQEGIFSVDHKTASRREDHLSLNNQFTGQCVLTKQTKMIVNTIGWQKTLKPEEKFERIAINISRERQVEWIQEVVSYAYDIVNCQHHQSFRHKFTSCQRRYGPCIFRKVCEGQPGDRERLLKEQFKVADKPWDINNDE